MLQKYAELQKQLNVVRWAWKRAAAGKGLAAVLMEGLGLFLVFALLDFLYVLPQQFRIGALLLMGAVLTLLFIRHVMRPLLRRIPDEQLALYVEERQKNFDGALISAAAFGREPSKDRSAMRDYIVASVVREAAQQAGQLKLSRILDLARLRKYFVAAMVVLAFFAMTVLSNPGFFRRQAGRLFKPWQMTLEDQVAAGTLVETEKPVQIELTWSPDKTRILRGSAITVKAKFNRLPDRESFLRFRTQGSAEIHKLKMDEIDELNGFEIRLADINEDIEFDVQCGRFVSKQHGRISVYDPLALKGYELTLTPPSYTRQKPHAEFGPSGDVTALIGTRVKFRAVGSSAILGGVLAFDGGVKIQLAPDGTPEQGAAGEFQVTKDTSYTVRLEGADGQVLDEKELFFVKALEDRPPTMTITTPGADMAVIPMAEVRFAAQVNDDVGLARLEMLYQFGEASEPPERLKFDLGEQPRAGEHEYVRVLYLENFKRPPQPGDTLFYHFVTEDLKGHRVLSDLYMLSIRPYEVAGAFPAEVVVEEPEFEPEALQLMVYIAAAWNIHVTRKEVPAEEFKQRCEKLGAAMRDEDGNLRKFHHFEVEKMAPEQAEQVEQAEAFIEKGIKILRAYAPLKAVALWKKAQAIFDKLGTGLDHQDEATAGGAAMNFKKDPMRDALGFVKMEIPLPPAEKGYAEVPLPDYRRQLSPEAAEQLKKKAQALEKRQAQLLSEVRKEARQNRSPQEQEAKPNGAGSPQKKKPSGANQDGPKQAGQKQAGQHKSGQQQDGPKQAGQHATPQEQQQQPDLAMADRGERKAGLQRKQQRLAAEAQALAKALLEKAPKGDRTAKEVAEHIRRSAKEMTKAGEEIKKGDFQVAASRGERARKELQEGIGKLQTAQFRNLEAAVEAAEDKAGRVAERQERINRATKEVVKDIKKRTKKSADDAKLRPRERRKLQGLAKLQVENQKAGERLQAYVRKLAQWAHENQKKETAANLKKALRTMKQEDFPQAMVSAAVNLGQQYLEDAQKTQEKVQHAIGKVRRLLKEAGHALAQSREEKLKSALKRARGIAKKAEALTGKGAQKKARGKGEKGTGEKEAGAQKAAGEKPAGEQTAEKKPGASKPGTAQGKTEHGKPGGEKAGPRKNGREKGETAQGREKGQPGKRETQPGKTKPGGKAEQADGQHRKGEGKAQAGEQQAGAPPDKSEKGGAREKGSSRTQPLSEEEKRRQAKVIYRETQRLAERIERDQLVEVAIRTHVIRLVKDKKSFEEMFQKAQRTKLKQYLKALREVTSRLEYKLASTLKAKRLSNAQREECPIVYRKMVNNYYETLATQE